MYSSPLSLKSVTREKLSDAKRKTLGENHVFVRCVCVVMLAVGNSHATVSVVMA